MESSVVTIIVVIIIGIILVAVVLTTVFHSTSSAKSTTTVSYNTTTTTAPVAVDFYNVNVEYVYTGPSKVGNASCGYKSFAYTSGQSQRLNGSELFYLQYTESSYSCPLTIYNVTVNTPGFALIATVPYLPMTIPDSSTAQLQLDIRTPDQNFYGPLSITIYYS